MIKTSPPLGFNNPKIIPMVVVFPHPLGPSIPIISFLLTTAIIYLLFWPVPIEPTAWESPKDSRIDPIFSLNQELKDIKIFWINDGYVGPEDIVLKNDEIYVGYNSGVIMNVDGIFSDTKGRPLGMAFDSNDNLIVADAIQGLISIDGSGEVTSLST